jgi:non-specific serine/threonine protein kinase
LFGRETDAAAIRTLIATAPGRLVTILGAGGCGKTSLALEIAHEAVPGFADEGFWVPLDQCYEGSSLAAAVGSSMGGLPASSGSTEEALVAGLAARQVLLVLDNCEHLVAPVALLVDKLLDRCPDLRILATSRVPLKVRGEHVHSLEPLPVPEARHLNAPGEMEKLPSVAMFLDRRGAAGVRAKPNPRELEVIGRICAGVDGLPLAIELAAAQTFVFSAEEISERLKASLPLPVHPGGTLPERQQTMQRTLEWSLSLVSESERRVFSVCGVFSGSWTIAALEAVAPEEVPAAPAVARLVESSLISVLDGDERRYRLLAPVREHAVALTLSEGMLGLARDRHARHYSGAARAFAGQQALRPPEARGLTAIHADYENYVAALDWALETANAELAFWLANSLWLYWRLSGQAQVGRDRFETLLRMKLPRRTYAAMSHAALANFLQLLGEREAAAEQATIGLGLFRHTGDAAGATLCLGTLGELASEQEDYAQAREYYREALTDLPDGPAWAKGILLADWGIAEYWAGELDRARDLFAEAAEALSTQPQMWYGGLVRIRQGCIARARSELSLATALIRDGLSAVNRLGAGQEVAHGLEELAAVECSGRDFSRATVLLAAAARLREQANTPIAPSDRAAVQESFAATRSSLRERDFSAAWVQGRGLTRSEAVAFALSDADAQLDQVLPFGELTAREREVAHLVAEGLTNRQIANRLTISEGTARTHVERIRNKLGVSSRASITRLVASTS